ncbi:hypothetical protein Q8A67_018753 [Cirrhinus molitorella]|uniref:Uncharacterized protein n=1 Tax=Cirrhinus molitorella TaxID=172907 RepID=A0AA88PDF2_9TELE|nr:hypothetical protein Q8A67_018753 [Cirrhinus molitorella]
MELGTRKAEAEVVGLRMIAAVPAPAGAPPLSPRRRIAISTAGHLLTFPRCRSSSRSRWSPSTFPSLPQQCPLMLLDLAEAPSLTFPLPQQFPLPLEHLPYPPPPQLNPLPLPLEPLPFLPTITAVPTPAGGFSISCRSSTPGSPSHILPRPQ